jgi:hypothetical protein
VSRGRLLLVCILLSLYACLSAQAYPYKVDSLVVELDALAPTEDGNFRLTFAGQSEIVARESLERRVLELLAAQPVLIASLAREALLHTTKARCEKSAEEVCEGLLSLCALHPEVVVPQLRGILANLPQDNARGHALLRTSRTIARFSAEHSAMRAALLVRAGLLAAQTALADVTGFAFSHSVVFRQELAAVFEFELLQPDVVQAQMVLQLVREVYGEGDAQYQELNIAWTRIGPLIEELSGNASSESEDAGFLLDRLLLDRNFAQTYKQLLLALVTQALAEGPYQADASKGLALLLRIPEEWEDAHFHSLLKTQLSHLSVQDKRLPQDVASAERLRQIASRMPSVRELLLLELTRLVQRALEKKAVQRAEAYIADIVSLRPDPNPENDSLRILQARAYLGLGSLDQALKAVERLPTGAPLFLRLRIFLFRYGSLLGVLSAVLVGVLLIIGYHRLRKRAQPLATPNPGIRVRSGTLLASAAETNVDDAEEEAHSARPFVAYGVAAAHNNPKMNEYKGCLIELGLQLGCRREDIKTAYRNKVKLAHPDLVDSGVGRPNEEFLRLTAAYERALVLRDELKLE